MTLFKYQLVSSFCLCVLIPAMTIGSSAQMRSDISRIQTALVGATSKMLLQQPQDDHPEPERGNVYAMSNGHVPADVPAGS